MLIKTTKDGRKVEVIGEHIYLGGAYHAATVSCLTPARLVALREIKHDVAYMAGSIMLTEEEGRVAIAQIESAKRAKASDLKAAIPGLDILRSAYRDAQRYGDAISAMMETETNDGSCQPSRPAADLDALRNQYPRAAAYLRAEAYASAAHHTKADAGAKALALLAAGGSLEDASKLMDTWAPDSAQWA